MKIINWWRIKVEKWLGFEVGVYVEVKVSTYSYSLKMMEKKVKSRNQVWFYSSRDSRYMLIKVVKIRIIILVID